jgi:hypothetical protein
MRGTIPFRTLIVWLLAAATLTAQAGVIPDPHAAPPESASVTVTGCLSPGIQAGTFLLANATREATPPPGKETPSHHSDAQPSPKPARPAETLRLAGGLTRLKLGDHVRHIVSLTGMFAGEDRIVTPGIVLPDAPAGGDKPGPIA